MKGTIIDDLGNIDISSWTEEITTFYMGKYFTLSKYEFHENLAVDLNPSLNYSIFVHDPNFFVANFVPETIPYLLFTFDDTQSQAVWIKATYQNFMDKEDKHCIASISYSFSECSRSSVSVKVG